MSREHHDNNYSVHLIKYQSSDDDCKIEELLKPVETLPLDSDSEYSDITDIFEEFHRDSFLRANADPSKNHLSKIEADWKTVERFTDEFKKAMSEVREESQIHRSLLEEEESINAILSRPLESGEQKVAQRRRSSAIAIEEEKDGGSEGSSQSLVWERLLRNSEGRFKVSPLFYDAFKQEEKHWLERPPISWKVVDRCRVKCDRWLDEVMGVGTEYRAS